MKHNLSGLEDSELIELADAVSEERSKRSAHSEPVKVKVVISTGSGRRKGWIKHVTSIDKEKRGGYAFNGDFLDDGLVYLPEGSLVLDCAPTGSLRRSGMQARLIKVTRPANREPLVIDWETNEDVTVLEYVEDWFQCSLVILEVAEKELGN